MAKGISMDLRNTVMKWVNVIEENVVTKQALGDLVNEVLEDLVGEMRDFAKEDKHSIIFYDDAKKEPCPRCNYEQARVYQWLGRWYFMCRNCAHGIPEPVLVDWGKYGDLNEEEKKGAEEKGIHEMIMKWVIALFRTDCDCEDVTKIAIEMKNYTEGEKKNG